MTNSSTPSIKRNASGVEISWKNILFAHNRVDDGWQGMVLRAAFQDYPMYEWNGRVYETKTNTEVGVTSELFSVQGAAPKVKNTPTSVQSMLETQVRNPQDTWFKSTDTPSQKRAAVTLHIKEMVSEQLGLEVSQISDTAHFVKDLGADSLDTVEMVMYLEDEMSAEIDDETANRLETIPLVADFVLDYFNNKRK